MLENAKVTLLDDGESRYHLVIKAPDGQDLNWHLRTEMGAGPLALLKLRGIQNAEGDFSGQPKRALNGVALKEAAKGDQANRLRSFLRF